MKLYHLFTPGGKCRAKCFIAGHCHLSASFASWHRWAVGSTAPTTPTRNSSSLCLNPGPRVIRHNPHHHPSPLQDSLVIKAEGLKKAFKFLYFPEQHRSFQFVLTSTMCIWFLFLTSCPEKMPDKYMYFLFFLFYCCSSTIACTSPHTPSPPSHCFNQIPQMSKVESI